MPFEEIFKEPAYFLKHHPKAVLPAVLSIIPGVLFLSLAALFLSANSQIFDATNFQQALQDPSVISKLAGTLVAAILPLAVVVIVSWLAELLLGLVHVQLALQAQEKKSKQVRLEEAFANSRKHLKDFAISSLIAYAIVFLLVLVAAAIAFLLIALTSTVFGALGTLAGVLVAALLGLTAVAVLVCAIVLASATFWLLPVVVSLEGKGGVGAIKRSFSLAKTKPLHFVALMLVVGAVGFVFSQVSSLFVALPFVGYALSQIIALPFTAWALLLPTTFYLEYLQKRK